MKKFVKSITSQEDKFYLCSRTAQLLGLKNLDDYNVRIFNHHFKNKEININLIHHDDNYNLVNNVNNILDEIGVIYNIDTVDQVFILFMELLENLNIPFKHNRTNKSSYIELINEQKNKYIYYKNCLIDIETKNQSNHSLLGLITADPPKYMMNIEKSPLLKKTNSLLLNNKFVDFIYGIILKLTYKDNPNDNIEEILIFSNAKFNFVNKKNINNEIYLFYVFNDKLKKNGMISIDIDDNINKINKIMKYEFYQISINFGCLPFRKQLFEKNVQLIDVDKFISGNYRLNTTGWMTISKNENLSKNTKIGEKKICGLIFEDNPQEVILFINGLESYYNETDINCYKVLYDTDKYIIKFSINDKSISYFNLSSIDNFKLIIKKNVKIQFEYVE